MPKCWWMESLSRKIVYFIIMTGMKLNSSIVNYKIIWIVRVFLMANKCVFIGCLHVARIYNFMEEIKLYKRASFIVVLFVKLETNNFIKEIKHVLRAFIAWWKPHVSLWEFSSKWKSLTVFWVFTSLLSNSRKRSHRFSPSYEGTENMFYFLID